MRISDWSSDVCSSDLGERDSQKRHRERERERARTAAISLASEQHAEIDFEARDQHQHREAYQREHVHRGARGEQRKPAWTHGDAEGDLEHERWDRSEEHTSELQSLMRRSSAVFCLYNNNTTHISLPTIEPNDKK